jgi:hypothetical protein
MGCSWLDQIIGSSTIVSLHQLNLRGREHMNDVEMNRAGVMAKQKREQRKTAKGLYWHVCTVHISRFRPTTKILLDF